MNEEKYRILPTPIRVVAMVDIPERNIKAGKIYLINRILEADGNVYFIFGKGEKIRTINSSIFVNLETCQKQHKFHIQDILNITLVGLN